jgi:hypothetical protein
MELTKGEAQSTCVPNARDAGTCSGRSDSFMLVIVASFFAARNEWPRGNRSAPRIRNATNSFRWHSL